MMAVINTLTCATCRLDGDMIWRGNLQCRNQSRHLSPDLLIFTHNARPLFTLADLGFAFSKIQNKHCGCRPGWRPGWPGYNCQWCLINRRCGSTGCDWSCNWANPGIIKRGRNIFDRHNFLWESTQLLGSHRQLQCIPINLRTCLTLKALKYVMKTMETKGFFNLKSS